MSAITWLVTVLAMAAAPAAGPPPARGADGAPGVPLEAAADATGPRDGRGLWVVVDPESDALLEPTHEELSRVATELFTAELREASSTSHDGLYPVEIEDGVMVDLQGRFQSVLFAIVGPQGDVTTTHDPAALWPAVDATRAGQEEDQ